MITPPCLRGLYNAAAGTSAIKNYCLGVVEYTPQVFLPPDLNMWFKQFSPGKVSQSPNTNLIDGAIVQT